MEATVEVQGDALVNSEALLDQIRIAAEELGCVSPPGCESRFEVFWTNDVGAAPLTSGDAGRNEITPASGQLTFAKLIF